MASVLPSGRRRSSRNFDFPPFEAAAFGFRWTRKASGFSRLAESANEEREGKEEEKEEDPD